MHEKRHFLSYRKRRHDAENHVHICALHHSGEQLQNGQQPQGYRLGEKIPIRISKDEAPTLLSVVGPLFISSLLFHLSRALLGAWRFSLFRSVLYLSQQARPHQGACLLLGVLFYFPNLSLFVSSYVKTKKFCSSSIDQRFRGLHGLGFGVGLVTGSCHSLVFLLACPFVSRVISVLAIHCFFLWACPFVFRVISFIYDVRVRGGSLDV